MPEGASDQEVREAVSDVDLQDQTEAGQIGFMLVAAGIAVLGVVLYLGGAL